VSIVDAIVLGTLQGLTEFLPVSSSGHLALLLYFRGLRDVPRFFDVMLHVGTAAAVAAYYGRALWRSSGGGALLPLMGLRGEDSCDGGIRGRRFRIVWLLLLAMLPTVVAALVFRSSAGESTRGPSSQISWRARIGDWRDSAPERPWLVVGFLSGTGVVVLLGAHFRHGSFDAMTTRWPHAIGIGVAQAISAVCPGLSRSAVTITAATACGLRPEWAVHFSLLLSLPTVLGAAVLKAADVDRDWLTPANVRATLIGSLTSAVVGWLCIAGLLRAVRRGRWWWFAVYVWSLSALVAVVLWVGR
jgi:undecaprenyl-diphosphatase